MKPKKIVNQELQPICSKIFQDLVFKNEVLLLLNATTDDFGVFTEFNYSFSDFFAATAGARMDYVTAKIKSPDAGFLAVYGGKVSDKTDVTFAGHVGLKFNKKGWNSQLSFGRGVRTASMLERYIYRFEIGSDSRQYIGNPNLKPEVNYQTEWSISKK